MSDIKQNIKEIIFSSDLSEGESKLLEKQIIEQLDLAIAERNKEIVEMIEKRAKGWLGAEEDGSDRHECYDECYEIINLITNTNK